VKREDWREQLKEEVRSMPKVDLAAERDSRLFPWAKRTNDTPLPLTPFSERHGYIWAAAEEDE